MRQIRSVVKLTVPTIGNCASDQITAIASSTQRVRDAIDDEADDDGRDRKQQEERRAELAELLRIELQLGHDRHAGKADHDLVGEIHQHEQKQEKRDLPGALGRRLCGHGCFPVLSLPVLCARRWSNASHGFPGKATAAFCGYACTASVRWPRHVPDAA